MGRRLAAAVHVRDPRTNEWLILLPGEEPDEDLAEAITHPDAWEPGDDEGSEDGGEGDPPAGGTEPITTAPVPAPVVEPVVAPTPSAVVEPVVEPTPAADPKPKARTRKQADEQ
ncbi:hypothetical protein ACWEQN_38670 [Streptomyces sp. NPDC004129]|uniref:hypothetical protein n=1 Tax=Streptomyces sp. NPDC004533 TaxID=3154278 RepID=UPI0033A54EA8